jgi:hypothetical protein
VSRPKVLESIKNLEAQKAPLYSPAFTGTVSSSNTDYAEVGEWADGNIYDEDRIGYFVAIDESSAGTTMIKSTSTSDVRGVTVASPAFSENCSGDKFNSDGTLKKQYDYVAVMGIVSVIDDSNCTVNGRCMPNDRGIAVPSSNNLGYQVIDRIDSNHIMIAVEPGADMIQRIKNDNTVTSDIPLHLRVTESGTLQIVYNDGE